MSNQSCQLFKCSDCTPPFCWSDPASPWHPVRALGSRPPSTAIAMWVLLQPEVSGVYIRTPALYSRVSHSYTRDTLNIPFHLGRRMHIQTLTLMLHAYTLLYSIQCKPSQEIDFARLPKARGCACTVETFFSETTVHAIHKLFREINSYLKSPLLIKFFQLKNKWQCQV